MSTFLQERLQKERRAESEKLGSSTSSRHNFDMSASVDLGRVSDKPFRVSDLEPQRPQSSAGMESGKKKGLGVKEMEQVVSSLHKQNFDLKLELYHRRERQTKMEERLDALESEKQEATKLSEKLLADLEKRDKAIEEAVSMIVELEARVDQLLNERTMVKHVESQGFYASTDGFEDYDDSIANSSAVDLTQQHQDRSKTPTVNRMPSFLSDHNATTENLRNVYIHNRASITSLRRVSGGHSEADNAMINGLASPTLSVLSESSFMSVYGQKGGDTTVIPDFDEPLTLNGFDGSSPVVMQESPAPNSNNHRGHPYCDNGEQLSKQQQRQQYSAPTQPQPINDILNSDSPLQRLERIDSGSRTAAPEVPMHQVLRNEASQNRRNSINGSPARRSTKDEKRAALRKVMTDAPGGVRLHDQTLPPTPDTISSSTLQRYKNSNDNLSVRHQNSNERQRFSGSDLQPTAEQPLKEQTGGVPLMHKELSRHNQNSRKEAVETPTYDPYGAKNIPRPRSAGDTTVSHKRNHSWDSDDSDTKSLQSSLDIWMRESTKPPRTTGRTSPDLFGFPTSMGNGGWAKSALFDPKQRLGAMPSTDYMHDLLSLREALLSPNLPPPPPPDRRSSLYSHARSASAMPTSAKPLAAEGTWQPPPPDVGSPRNRRNSDIADMRSDMRTPVQREQKQPEAPNHPPISWQQGPRAGLKGLFRRSLTGGGPPVAGSPAKSECGPCVQESDPTPMWASRSSAASDMDRTGATPPPIMLNPRQGRRSSAAAASMDGIAIDSQSMHSHSVQGDAMSQHSIPQSQSAGGAQLTGAASGTGARRKWLPGFSRNKA